jgi:hypothetical protein
MDRQFLDALRASSTPQEAIDLCNKHLHDMLDLVEAEGMREPMDTIGNLVDKLVTVNCKMWHNQELLYAIRKMAPEEFEGKYGKDLKGLHHVIERACTLNVQRAQLMDEIDVMIVKAIKTGDAEALNLFMRPQAKMY